MKIIHINFLVEHHGRAMEIVAKLTTASSKPPENLKPDVTPSTTKQAQMSRKPVRRCLTSKHERFLFNMDVVTSSPATGPLRWKYEAGPLINGMGWC